MINSDDSWVCFLRRSWICEGRMRSNFKWHLCAWNGLYKYHLSRIAFQILSVLHSPKQTIPWRYQWTEVILHEVSDRSHNLVPIERGVTTGQIAIEVPCFAPTQSHIANSETRFCWLCGFKYAIIFQYHASSCVRWDETMKRAMFWDFNKHRATDSINHARDSWRWRLSDFLGRGEYHLWRRWSHSPQSQLHSSLWGWLHSFDWCHSLRGR